MHNQSRTKSEDMDLHNNDPDMNMEMSITKVRCKSSLFTSFKYSSLESQLKK